MRLIASFGVALAATAAVPALAADPDCELGVVGGSVFGRSQHVAANQFAFTDTFDVDGRAIGVKFGCLAARDRAVYGAALDLSDTTAKGSAQEIAPNQNFFSETAFDWIATMRGIVGYQVDPKAMLYVTAGLAFSAVKIRVCAFSGPATGTCGSASETVWGVVGGVGAQHRMSRRWSMNVEYLAFGFENKEFPAPGPFSNRGGGVRPEAQMLRAGLSFHF